MANPASMGPPLSPREPRRSGRRSGHSHSNSTSASRSPNSPTPTESRSKEGPSSGKQSGSNTNSRNGKRPKQEDFEDSVEDSQRSVAASSVSSSSTAVRGSGRTKRKSKASIDAATSSAQPIKSSGGNSRDPSVSAPDDDEDQGITRCICESTEDDPDAGEFMVQCETCKAWQHGLCMGYQCEGDLPPDYHCEQCRPDLHVELLERLTKRARQSSSKTLHSASSGAAAASRNSRSHSPSHASKPTKRRNTMNSRDANFEIIFKETLAATAAEAEAAAHADAPTTVATEGNLDPEEDAEGGSKRRRKRSDDDAAPSKRTRSTSSASDRPVGLGGFKDDSQPPKPTSSVQAKNPSRNRRGGARKSAAAAAAVIQEVGALDAEDAPPPKRSSHNARNRSSHARRPPASHGTSHAPALSHSESRRNISGAGGNSNAGGGANASGSGGGASVPATAYRLSHAYAVSQQPLFTSWGLPDYLNHLEEMLPSEVPKPLEVRGSGLGGEGGAERNAERGVKVKWPGKRMSMGDMNKRVRALVEWVGREQAGTGDREKRRELLEGKVMMDSDAMVREGVAENTTMKMMEALMEELIGFQERFGPGVKSRERDRRAPAS